MAARAACNLPTGKEVDVKIPAGLSDGQQIRLKGQGFAGAGGAPGDAIITVHIAKHPYFERDGANIRLELPITLYEAVLGGKVRVPTLDGAVELAIPGQHQRRAHLPPERQGPAGQGAARAICSRPCASCCRTTADAELEELMRKLRDSKPYDPRKDLA